MLKLNEIIQGNKSDKFYFISFVVWLVSFITFIGSCKLQLIPAASTIQVIGMFLVGVMTFFFGMTLMGVIEKEKEKNKKLITVSFLETVILFLSN